MPSSGERAPLVILDTVGLTARMLPLAPRLARLAREGWSAPLREVVPAVTSTAQASILTGTLPDRHGIVANGWLFRDTMEVRFWQQSNRLLEAEPFYQTARQLARERQAAFRCAQLFWWFNQGADVDLSLTPKPHYGADGSKVLAITGTPEGLAERIERQLGRFPFPSFWGPLAGLPATEWIARSAALVLRSERPDLCLVYLPHLDYDPQRYGPDGCDIARCAGELDAACTPVLDAAQAIGARVWVVNEYSHCPVRRAAWPNRLLRRHDFLTVRPGPFGEMLDPFQSRALAVCDHQICHVYVRQPGDVAPVANLLRSQPEVGRVLTGGERSELALGHPRSGEIVALAQPDAWFAYPYWLDDAQAPDFARTVDIHRKPGFDPCEMFFDPHLTWPKGRVAWRLLQKKLGMRALLDVVPLDARLVRGSHGLPALDPADRPILIGDGRPPSSLDQLSLAHVRDLVLQSLFPE